MKFAPLFCSSANRVPGEVIQPHRQRSCPGRHGDSLERNWEEPSLSYDQFSAGQGQPSCHVVGTVGLPGHISGADFSFLQPPRFLTHSALTHVPHWLQGKKYSRADAA